MATTKRENMIEPAIFSNIPGAASGINSGELQEEFNEIKTEFAEISNQITEIRGK